MNPQNKTLRIKDSSRIKDLKDEHNTQYTTESPVTVHSVPSGQDPATVHPWLLSSKLAAAVVVTPEQAGAASHAGADTPLRLYTARVG